MCLIMASATSMSPARSQKGHLRSIIQNSAAWRWVLEFSARKGGAKGIYIAEGHGEVFGVQLAGHGEAGFSCRRNPGCNPPGRPQSWGTLFRSRGSPGTSRLRPSQSEPVMMGGVNTIRSPGSGKTHARHRPPPLRTRNVAENRLVRGADAGWSAEFPHCGAFLQG